MKISKIEPQKKNKNRCSIFIDGKFRFGLTKDLAIKHDLQEGAEISEVEIEDILLQAEKRKIRERAFKIMHYRERSTRELRNRLNRIGYDPAIVNEIIDDFVADRTLDDERFARAFVSDYTKLKPKGNRFIFYELTKRGISKDLVTQIIDKRDERGLVKAYIEHKLKHLNKHNPKERQKIVRRLLSRGFTPDIIFEVIDEKS